MEIQMAKNAGTGQKTKMQILYDYLTGLQFRQRMQAIVENYGAMQEDLLRERKLITKQWAKREMQLTNVMESAVGLHGDIIGIAGGAVAEIPGLEIKQITKED